MIYFGIRLQSKQVSKDWELVSELFNRTLWSVYNQTDPDFHIIVACHEIPILRHVYDERVEFIQVCAPIPQSHDEMMVDAGYKTHTIAMRIRELGGGFTMMVDADDLISNRVAEFVNKHQQYDGWTTGNLYYYQFGTDYLMYGHHFPCTHIIKYFVDELPSEYPEVMTNNNDSLPWIIRKRHGGLDKACKEAGKKLHKLPFRAYVYVRNTGFNHSLSGGKKESTLRKIEHFLSPKVHIKGKVKKEFSIDWM